MSSSTANLIVQTIAFSTIVYGFVCDFRIPLLVKGAVIGKGIYLTHQTLWILLAYFTVGLTAAISRAAGRPLDKLERFQHWACCIAGGFGIFLTFMFYALCWSNASFHKNIVKPQEAAGLPFSYFVHVMHAPAIFLVLLDACTKQRTILKEGNVVEAPQDYIKYFVGFGAWYVFVLRWNHSATGIWPYPFMDEFTAEWNHWVFYCFCFGFIWALGMAHRAFMFQPHIAINFVWGLLSGKKKKGGNMDAHRRKKR